MKRFTWVLILALGCLFTLSLGNNSKPVSCGVLKYQSGIVKKNYTSLQDNHQTNLKIKFKKRRIRDTAQVIQFHPEYSFEQYYFLHNYIPLKTQVLASPLSPGENVRRGPPSLLS